MPGYTLQHLLAACCEGKGVHVSKGAVEGSQYFGLETSKAVREFIANGGIEQPHFIRSDVWRNNPKPSIVIYVDSYAFFSGPRYGYFAFLFSPLTNTWIVKSFKPNIDPDPRSASASITGSSLASLGRPEVKQLKK